MNTADEGRVARTLARFMYADSVVMMGRGEAGHVGTRHA